MGFIRNITRWFIELVAGCVIAMILNHIINWPTNFDAPDVVIFSPPELLAVFF